jgi:hypothetical protein
VSKVIKSGTGWRLGWDADRGRYPGLIGADDWAMELTQAELTDFCRLLAQLAANMRSIASELMEGEKIACSAETELIWMEAEGFADCYSLRSILKTDRNCEGNWTATAVPELIAAASNLELF